MWNIAHTRLRIGQRVAAFTLTEVLVVVAIIALLIALFVPAVGAMRRSAWQRDTLHRLSSIRAACEGYFANFAAYPGPISDERLYRDPYAPTAPQYGAFSGSQNLTLGLCGSLWQDVFYPPGAGQVRPPDHIRLEYAKIPMPPVPDIAGENTYRIYCTDDPRGVVNLNVYDTSKRDPILLPQFYTPRAGELYQPSGVSVANMPTVRVLVDGYPDALPVLYYRRDRAATALSTNAGTAGASGAYYIRSNRHYTDSTNLTTTKGTTQSQATSGYNSANLTTQVTAGFNNHFEETIADATTGSPTARGGFVLISAGLDRIYGPMIKNGQKTTSDDIVVFGGN